MSLGPTFGDECNAAGLNGLPFSWSSDGTIHGREDLTTQQNATLDAVIAAHNPLLQRQPIIPFSTFLARWTDAEYLGLLRGRAAGIQASVLGLIKQWDIIQSTGQIDMNAPSSAAFKQILVTNNILTQPRADIIFG